MMESFWHHQGYERRWARDGVVGEGGLDGAKVDP